jgi:hypothetical protein
VNSELAVMWGVNSNVIRTEHILGIAFMHAARPELRSRGKWIAAGCRHALVSKPPGWRYPERGGSRVPRAWHMRPWLRLPCLSFAHARDRSRRAVVTTAILTRWIMKRDRQLPISHSGGLSALPPSARDMHAWRQVSIGWNQCLYISYRPREV